MNKKILTSLVVIGFAVAMASSGIAESEDDESSDIDVSVEEDLKLNVAPVSLSYSNVDPGSFNETSDEGFSGVEVENTGSVNITRVYVTATNPDSNPLGTGVASEYDAGNFLQLNPTEQVAAIEPSDGYQYINRKDFNVTSELAYFTEPEDSGEVRYGRFRTGNESFFWATTDSETSSVNGCQDSDSQLYIGAESQTQDRTGSVDFEAGTEGEDYEVYDIQNNANTRYGVVNTTTFGTFDQDKDYTVLTWCGQAGSADDDNSTHIITTKWNPEDPDGVSSGDELDSLGDQTVTPILDAENVNEHLLPGESFEAQVRVSVPLAIAQGQVSQGQLEVVVEGT